MPTTLFAVTALDGGVTATVQEVVSAGRYPVRARTVVTDQHGCELSPPEHFNTVEQAIRFALAAATDENEFVNA